MAYNAKRNWANGYDNTDGADETYSWNCGWEGDEDAPAQVAKLRRRQVKNLCCLLFLSNGTPIFRAGDEFMQTQAGNNNPYNQDNETAWLDWRRLDDNADVFRFFRRMIAFRKAHPSLARSHFWREDLRWYGVGREPDLSYDSRSLAFALHGASQRDDDLYVMINACWIHRIALRSNRLESVAACAPHGRAFDAALPRRDRRRFDGMGLRRVRR